MPVLLCRAARKLAIANRATRRRQIHTAAFLNWKQVGPADALAVHLRFSYLASTLPLSSLYLACI